MQATVKQSARPWQLARSDQRHNKGVLDDLALGMAAADADDIVKRTFELAAARAKIIVREGVQRPAHFRHHRPGRACQLGCRRRLGG